MSRPCNGCGVEIEFVKTQANRSMPVETQRIQIVTDDGRIVTGRLTHFGRCPKSDQFRRGRERTSERDDG